MKLNQIARIVAKRVGKSLRTDAFLSCFSIGVAGANFAVCAAGWHPFHFGLAIFSSVAAILLFVLPR